MRLNAENGRILLSVTELVEIARRGIAPTLPFDCPIDMGGREVTEGVPSVLFHDFTLGEHRFTLVGEADSITDRSVKVVKGGTTSPTKDERASARGEAYLLCYMLAKEKGLERVEAINIYEARGAKDSAEEREWLSRKTLESFFSKCLSSLLVYGTPEIERVTLRLPSLKNVKFPYAARREGQDEFIRRAYKNLTRGGTLYACAPTGTGKTVSVIYPALRALGTLRVSKVFYLTPKNTTALAAAECLQDFVNQGANIRAVRLTSKERLCKRGQLCRDGRELCSVSECKRLPDAVMELYKSGITVIGARECNEVAEKYSVCPHELELCYAEVCDAVICDCNYLFDPEAYIRRFFDVGGKFAFLIDEAHNLPERAREMYSAEICDRELREILYSDLISPLSKLKTELPELVDRFDEILKPYLSENTRRGEDGILRGASHLSEPPTELYGLFEKICALVGDEIKINLGAKDEEPIQRLGLLRELDRKVKSVRRALMGFDSGFKVFIFGEGENITLKLYCIDTGRAIRRMLNKGHAAIFFSATLTPIDYYRALLGGERESEITEVGSPFVPEQLSVSIVDKISIRYSERERTLPAVCRTVAAVMSARRGNYMVFCPSFEYLDMIHGAFISKYPKIKALKQTRDMSYKERGAFLEEFDKDDDKYLVGFCVLGGVYSEGIDLTGKRLIGAVVVGIGIPALSYEREAIAEYFEDKYEAGKQYAYIYPGMNRVFQAAGRVIRTEGDRGVIVLIDDRFADPIYKKSIPALWRGMEYVSDAKELRERIDSFWRSVDEE